MPTHQEVRGRGIVARCLHGGRGRGGLSGGRGHGGWGHERFSVEGVVIVAGRALAPRFAGGHTVGVASRRVHLDIADLRAALVVSRPVCSVRSEITIECLQSEGERRPDLASRAVALR